MTDDQVAVPDQDTPPPIPDVPYVIGVGGGRHAVSHGRATFAVDHAPAGSRRVYATAACDAADVVISRYWGEFHRGNPYIATGVCPTCAWTVALDQDAAEAELAATSPASAELAALYRLVPDPTLYVRVCEAILDRRRQHDGFDVDSPAWAQLLGHATAHRPVVLFAEDCAEGSCDHRGEAECYSTATVAACPTCSVRPGWWAGESEGQFEVTVPAPCAVLPVMAADLGQAAAPRWLADDPHGHSVVNES